LLFHRKSDGKTKKKILSCIFSEKVVLEKGRVATTPFSIPVQVLINTSKVLEGSKNKKEVENDLLSISAPLTCQNLNQIRKELEILCGLNNYLSITYPNFEIPS